VPFDVLKFSYAGLSSLTSFVTTTGITFGWDGTRYLCSTNVNGFINYPDVNIAAQNNIAASSATDVLNIILYIPIDK
jgi:hypothetical protein